MVAELLWYCDKMYVKRNIPTVCFALMEINLLTWHALLMGGSYIQYPVNNSYNSGPQSSSWETPGSICSFMINNYCRIIEKSEIQRFVDVRCKV